MNRLKSITTLILCIALSGNVFASSKEIRTLELSIKNQQSQKITLKQELEYTRVKLKEAQTELTSLQVENKTKEIQLEKMQASMGKKPTAEQKEFIANESQRLELGETSIKSRRAAVSRLERKKRDIEKEIAQTDATTKQARNRIAALEDSNRSDAQAESSAKTYRLTRELEELKKENEQLRIAMAEEAQRTREANDEAKRFEEEKEQALKRLAERRAKEEARKLAEAEKQKEEAKLASAKKASKAEVADSSQTVLPGEKPIYKRSDGRKVVIRNRGVRTSTVMMPIADNIYEAEVVLEPGKSYFDVRKRRYRGYFPEKDGVAPYIFTYDLTDKSQPKLSVRRKSDDPDQMISNAKDPF